MGVGKGDMKVNFIVDMLKDEVGVDGGFEIGLEYKIFWKM